MKKKWESLLFSMENNSKVFKTVRFCGKCVCFFYLFIYFSWKTSIYTSLQTEIVNEHFATYRLDKRWWMACPYICYVLYTILKTSNLNHKLDFLYFRNYKCWKFEFFRVMLEFIITLKETWKHHLSLCN